MAIVERELAKCFFWWRKFKVVLRQLVRRGLHMLITLTRIKWRVSFSVTRGLWKVGRLKLHEHGLEKLHKISLGALIKRVHLVVQYLKTISLDSGLLEIWRFRVWTFCQALLKIKVGHLILLELSYPVTHLTFAPGFLRLVPWTEFLQYPAALAALHLIC